MRKEVQKILDAFEGALGLPAEDTFREGLNDFMSGTSAEIKAARGIAQNVADAIERVKMATPGSLNDLQFAVNEAKHGAIALAEAKAIRLKRAAISAFFDVVTLYLRRVA